MSTAPVVITLNVDTSRALAGFWRIRRRGHRLTHPRRLRGCVDCNPRLVRRTGPPPAPHARGYHAKTRRRNRR